MLYDLLLNFINEFVLIDIVFDNSKDFKVKNDEYDYYCCFMNMVLQMQVVKEMVSVQLDV